MSGNINNFFKSLPLNVKKILDEYKKPIHDNIFYDNKKLLRHNSQYILFDKERWKMRPHIFCKDHYGDNFQYVYPVILTINNISSFFDFIPDNFPQQVIVTPNINTMFYILSKRYKGFNL